MENENMAQLTESIAQNYYDLSRLGKNEWWRYLLSFGLIVLFWLGGSLLLVLLLYMYFLVDNNPATGFDSNSTFNIDVNPLANLAVSLMSFIPLLISIILAVKLIHRRPVTSLITPYKKVDWKRIGVGILAIWILAIFSCVLEAVLYPGRYQFSFDSSEFFKYVPLILVFIPIQATTEELIFRGYFTQSLNLLFKRPWIAIVLSSTVFMLMHYANPEVSVNVVLTLGYYFTVGLFMAVITLKDNRLELALGCHIGINLFVLVANYSGSVLPVPSIFTVTVLDPVYNLVSFIIMAALFYLFLNLAKKRELSYS